MKFSRYILILFILISVQGFAQWGVKGGIDYGTVTEMDLPAYRAGFHIGATYDMPLSPKMYFQTGVLFGLQSFGFHQVGYDENLNKKQAENKSMVDNYNIEVPVTLSFRPEINRQKHIKLIIDLGLYGKYGLFGNVKYYDVDNTVYKGTTFRGEGNGYKRLLIGVGAGAGIQFDDKIYTCLGFQYGLTGIESQSHVKNMIFRLSIGYRF
ncbi:hypothetical protein FACS1894169_13030 [Bacteroidia bacterium]|nr:hypothetical protein FACS1894169_13030 [Bacteroidia bacterium]